MAAPYYPAITKRARQAVESGWTMDFTVEAYTHSIQVAPVPAVGPITPERTGSGEVFYVEGSGAVVDGVPRFVKPGWYTAAKPEPATLSLLADRVHYFAAVQFVDAYRAEAVNQFRIRVGSIGRVKVDSTYSGDNRINGRPNITIAKGRYVVEAFGTDPQTGVAAATVRKIIPEIREEPECGELFDVEGELWERMPDGTERKAEPAAEWKPKLGDVRARIPACLFQWEPNADGLFDTFTSCRDLNALLRGLAFRADQTFALSMLADWILDFGDVYYPPFEGRGFYAPAIAEHIRKLGTKPDYRTRIKESKAVHAANRQPPAF